MQRKADFKSFLSREGHICLTKNVHFNRDTMYIYMYSSFNQLLGINANEEVINEGHNKANSGRRSRLCLH